MAQVAPSGAGNPATETVRPTTRVTVPVSPKGRMRSSCSSTAVMRSDHHRVTEKTGAKPKAEMQEPRKARNARKKTGRKEEGSEPRQHARDESCIRRTAGRERIGSGLQQLLAF